MSDTDKPQDPKPEDKPKDGDTPSDGKDAQAEADKWKAMARKWEREAKATTEKLQKIEDADKTESQKAADKAAEAEKRAAAAELRALKLEVAADKGLTPKQAKRLVGESREDLESDADELLESFKPADDKSGDKPSGRPKEDLRGGSDPTEDPEEMDPKKLADMVPRY